MSEENNQIASTGNVDMAFECIKAILEQARNTAANSINAIMIGTYSGYPSFSLAN